MIARDQPLADRILGLVPINGLGSRLQDQALAQGELLEFKRRKVVFEAGARDPYTFYLLDGELDLLAEGSSPVRMQGGVENARRALAQLQPRRYTAITITNVTVFRIERAVLDHILADEQTLEEAGTQTMDVREIEDDEEDDSDWMTRLLSSALFMRLPHDNIQRFFAELEPMEAAEGDVVVEQGSDGDYLYIVAEGRCAVVRRAPAGGQEVQLAVLKEGDTFGDEALISNSPRNANVRMVTDGMLMRLPKNSFEELVSKPTLKALAWSEAAKLAEDGAQWLDVRFSDEHESTAIEGSINVPLNVLRLQANKLDADTTYIVYCDTGARSSAGAFLMLRLGFDACYLAGGLERSPLPQDPPTTPAKDPTLQPEDAAESAAVAAAAAAIEFEFVAGESATAEPGGDDVPAQDEAPAAQDPPAAPAAQAAEEAPPPQAAQKPKQPPEPAPKAPPAPAAQAPAPPTAARPAPAAAAPAQASAASAEMARARQILAQLKAERDKAAAFGQKAADAARELKRRNDELADAIKAERARREQLEKDIGAMRADAERAESMEQTRLQGELEKSTKRIEALQAERAEEQRKAAEELAKVRAETADNDEQFKAVAAARDEAEATRVAAEVAFQESLREATEKSERLAREHEKLQQELAQTRERLAEAEQQNNKAESDRLAETSEIKTEVALAQGRLEEAKEEFEQERARHAEEVERLAQEHEKATASLRTERAELDKAISASQARAEQLDRREMDLTEARASVDGELHEREQALAKSEEGLAAREEALSSEKTSWKQTVEKAITEERERLEADYARFREESESDLQQRAEALAAERIDERLDARSDELRAEHAARETAMRSQVEAHVAKLLAEFDERLARVRTGYETRLNEQETVLEDERRRLETEVVRLREALEAARGAARPGAAPAATAATPAPMPGPALDFKMNEATAVATDLTLDTGEPAGPDLTIEDDPTATAPPPAAAPEPTVDLEIEELTPIPSPEEAAAAQRSAELPLPLIEIPKDEAREKKESTARQREKDQRVISTDQLADIRKRMQDKMRAAKSRAG